jgi:hypothetical protein
MQATIMSCYICGKLKGNELSEIVQFYMNFDCLHFIFCFGLIYKVIIPFLNKNVSMISNSCLVSCCDYIWYPLLMSINIAAYIWYPSSCNRLHIYSCLENYFFIHAYSVTRFIDLFIKYKFNGHILSL